MNKMAESSINPLDDLTDFFSKKGGDAALWIEENILKDWPKHEETFLLAINRRPLFVNRINSWPHVKSDHILAMSRIFLRLLGSENFWASPSAAIMATQIIPILEDFYHIMNLNAVPPSSPKIQHYQDAFLRGENLHKLNDRELIYWAIGMLCNHRNYEPHWLQRKQKALKIIVENGFDALVNDNSVNPDYKLIQLLEFNIALTHIEGYNAELDPLQKDISDIRDLLGQTFLKLIDGKNIEEAENAQFDGNYVRGRTVVFLEKADKLNDGVYTCFVNEMMALDGEVVFVGASKPAFLNKRMFMQCEASPAGALKTVKSLQPENLILYTANMTLATVQLAYMKLAPKQYALPGYPVTTRSPYTKLIFSPAEISQHLASLSKDIIFRQAYPDFTPLAGFDLKALQKIRPEGAKVRIAIIANIYKITPALRRILMPIVKRDDVELLWLGRGNWSIKTAFAARTKCSFEPPLKVDDYLAKLASCHFLLSPFPFGNLVATVHALQLGVPTLSLKGSHPNSRAGAAALEKLGLNEFVVTSIADYEARMAKLIETADEITQKRAQVIKDANRLFQSPSLSLRQLIKQS